MTQSKEIYIISGNTPQELAQSLNMALGRIADRLDQMEGHRGTPTFYDNKFAFSGDSPPAAGFLEAGAGSEAEFSSGATTAAVAANTAHSGTTSGNPHSVTKSDVGLGNVENVDTTNADNIADGDTNAIITKTQETNFGAGYSHSQGDGSDHDDVATNSAARHTQGTDQGLDAGGANAVTAAQAKTAYTHSQSAHAPSNADNTAANETSHADVIVDGDFTAADEIMVGTGAGTHGQVTLGASQFLAKKAAGAATNVTAADARTILNVEDGANAYSHPDHSGDVTSSGDGATTIANGAVTLAKMANMATASLLGRNTAGDGTPEALAKATALSILNVEDGATADQTGAEIKSAYEAEDDTNAYTDDEKTKLSGIAAGADVTGSNAPQAHAASHQSGGGDAIRLDDLASPEDNTDLNVSTSAHGLAPKASNDTDDVLRGDGAFGPYIQPYVASAGQAIAVGAYQQLIVTELGVLEGGTVSIAENGILRIL